MNKLVICTTGTSIANSCAAQRQMSRQHNPWESDAEELRHQIKSFLQQPANDLATEKARRTVCAELNTLDRIGIASGDSIVLLASDTAQGRVCADMIRQVTMDAFGLSDSQVIIRRVNGLQVHSAKTLREQGLKNLVKIVLEYLVDAQWRYSYDIILNPTGGFKGIVPFLTILGMLYGKQTIYMFEFADELIILQPLPFSFDLNLYHRVKPALAYIDHQVAVPEVAYLGKIIDYTPAEHDLFMAFTEPFDNETITLSPLAYCLLSIDNNQESCLISPAALAALDDIQGVSQLVLKRMISQSGNPIWRNTHAHRWHTTDLLIMKRTRSPERIAGFVRNGLFHITHVFADHQDYERILSKYTVNDVKDDDFQRWKPAPDDIVNGHEEGDGDIILAQRDELLLKNKQLQSMLQQTTSQKDDALLEVMRLEERTNALQAEILRSEQAYSQALTGFREALEAKTIDSLLPKGSDKPAVQSPPPQKHRLPDKLINLRQRMAYIVTRIAEPWL